MKVTIHKKLRAEPGAFVTYSIDSRKEPIVEFYRLDSGYLVLGATCTGGYMRKFYKSEAAGRRWAISYAKTFCKLYWDDVEIVHDV